MTFHARDCAYLSGLAYLILGLVVTLLCAPLSLQAQSEVAEVAPVAESTVEAAPAEAAPPAEMAPSPEAPLPEEAAPPAEAAPQQVAAVAPRAEAPVACVPSCRSGYACHQGKCISACNPPCASGEACRADGECIPLGQVASAPGGAAAQSKAPPESETAIVSHTGFYLRLALGGGFGMGARYDSGTERGERAEARNAALFFSIDPGFSVHRNVIVHARVSGMAGGRARLSGALAAAEPVASPRLSHALVGLGLTAYAMPANIFGTAALGVARGVLHLPQDSATRSGVGLEFDLGKEWSLGKRLGVGLAGRFSYANFRFDFEPQSASAAQTDRLTSVGFALLLSATYN